MKPHTWSCSWYFKVEQSLYSFYSVFHCISSFSAINACILNDGPSFTTDVPKPDIIHFILYFHFNWTFALFHPICTLRVCNWAVSLLGVDIIHMRWYHKLVREMFNKTFQYLIDNISTVCYNIVFLTRTNSTIIFFSTLWAEWSYIEKIIIDYVCHFFTSRK